MSHTLFISDLHLSASAPQTVELFRHFLSERAPGADALYILGDLFDAWLGDDNQAPPIPDIVGWLRTLANSGTRIYLMHGNRDFLLGESFAKAACCELIDDPCVIELYGTPILLMHGDLLCTDDTAYLGFRAQVRDPSFIAGFLAKPLQERIAIAAEYRRMSGEATSTKAEDIMDVNRDAVLEQMKKQGVRRLIHGHTHRPAIHPVELDDKTAYRYVLGDWHPSDALILVADETGIRAETYLSA